MTKKALLTRFSSIGDIIITTPVIRALAEQRPDLEIHFATKHSYKALLENNPHIFKLHLLSNNFNDLITDLQAIEFDYFIDLHKNLRTFSLKRKLKYNKYFTYPKGNIEKSLLVNLKINKLHKKQNVERYFDALQSLNIAYDNKGLDFYFPENFEPTKSLSVFASSKFIAIAIGGKQNTKRLPYSMIMELCDKINIPIALIGGLDEKQEGENLAKHCDNVKNFCGELNLTESAWLIKKAERVISHDTGMMHLACALNKPLASIWGSTTLDFGFAPLFPTHSTADNIIIENSDISCRPCSRHGKSKCPLGHFKCMADLKLDDLATWANQL